MAPETCGADLRANTPGGWLGGKFSINSCPLSALTSQNFYIYLEFYQSKSLSNLSFSECVINSFKTRNAESEISPTSLVLSWCSAVDGALRSGAHFVDTPVNSPSSSAEAGNVAGGAFHSLLLISNTANSDLFKSPFIGTA